MGRRRRRPITADRTGPKPRLRSSRRSAPPEGTRRAASRPVGRCRSATSDAIIEAVAASRRRDRRRFRRLVHRDLGGALRDHRRRPRGGRQDRPRVPRDLAAVHPGRRPAHDRHLGDVDRDRDRVRGPRGARTAVDAPGHLRAGELLRVPRSGHAADRAAPVHLPRPAPDLGWLRRRADARPRRLRTGLQLRRVHDRGLPGRHPGDPERPARGGRGARHDRRDDDAPDHPAPGDPDRDPGHRQRVHRDDQGLRTRLAARRPGAAVARPAGRNAVVPRARDAAAGGPRLLDPDHRLLGRSRIVSSGAWPRSIAMSEGAGGSAGAAAAPRAVARPAVAAPSWSRTSIPTFRTATPARRRPTATSTTRSRRPAR